MKTHADGVHTFEADQRFFGLEMGARMTVLETPEGLVVHSPIGVDPKVVSSLGTLRWVVAPNLFHHLYVGPWIDAGAEAWAAPGLADKRPDLSFKGVLQADNHPFGDTLEVIPLACFSFTNEVVLLHKPSGTLVVTDLLFHIQPEAPWLTRTMMRALGGYPGCCTTVVERLGFDKTLARQEMAQLEALDFDRLIMSHGAVIDTGGKAAFQGAMAWLGR